MSKHIKIRLFSLAAVIILLISASVALIVMNTNSVNKPQVVIENDINNENIDMNEDNANSESTLVDITDEIKIEKVNPNDIFDFNSMSNLNVPVNNVYDGEYTITPGSSESDDDSRGDRADAGDDPAHADQLFDGSDWINDSVLSHETSTPGQYQTDDEDWFFINVQEKGNLETDYVVITINNSAPPHPTQPRELRCFLYDPLAILLNQDQYPLSGPLSGKTMSNTDEQMGTLYLDYEIIDPWDESTLDASPPISSSFLIRVICISQNYHVHYNITSIKVNTIKPVIPPHDMNNHPENGTVAPTEPTKTSPIKGNLLQNKDHWDWYEISNFIEFYATTWPNKIKYEVDVTREATGGGSFHTWTEVWVLYDSNLQTSTAYLKGDPMEYGGSPSVQVGGSATNPIKNNFEMHGEHAYIGIRTYSIGIASGQMFLSWYDGSVDYDLSFSVELQNKAPFLSSGKLEPEKEYYLEEEEISFSVTYRDQDNNAPTFVNLTIDDMNYEMESSGSNYVTGAIYTYKIDCSSLNNAIYPHFFNFSASDGLELAGLSLSPPKNQFKVIENQTPIIRDSAPSILEFEEDDDVLIIELSQIFEDVDPPDGLDYSIIKGSDKVSQFESSRIKVFIYQNTKLKFQLKENQHGFDDIVVNAKETLKRDSDTYYFSKSFKINISISNIKDSPVLDSISQVQAYQGEQIFFQISATDPDILTDGDELTFSTNRSDNIGVDDLEDFTVIPNDDDTSKANISFTPGNEHVGKLLVEVTVEDDDGQKDSQDVEFEILNVNDAPVITSIIKDKATTEIEADDTSVELSADEDEWYNFTVTIEDIDIQIGETNIITFRITNHTFTNPVEHDKTANAYLTGQIGVKPVNADVGTNYINLSVHDGKGGSDGISIIIEVENVNDPPDVPEILTAKVNKFTPSSTSRREFSIVDLVMFEGITADEDLLIPDSEEEITYTWYLKDERSEEELRNPEPYNKVEIQFPTPYLPYNDKEIKAGNYTLKLVVSDIEGEEQDAEVYLLLHEDFDKDQIPDDWEMEYNLDPHDRDDATMDVDDDGYSNFDEYKGNTDPRDPGNYPGGKGSKTSEDNTAIIIVILLVVVIIVLLLLFMFMRKRKKEQEAMEKEVEELAYPSEEGPDMGLGFVPPAQQPGGPGTQMPPPGPGGMPMPPPPEFIKYMQMMQQQQQVQPGPKQPTTTGTGQTMAPTQQQSQKTTTIPQATTPTKSTSIDTPAKGPQLGGPQLTPKLPPAKPEGEEVSGDMEGRQAPIDSAKDEGVDEDLGIEEEQGSADGIELVPGSPEYLDSDQTKDMGMTENGPDHESSESTENGAKENNNRMTCPNCGVEVKSGWFLCPGCKSPLN